MPSSRLDNVPWVGEQIYRLKPASLLDVGCGLGLYGLLARQCMDVYGPGSFQDTGRFRNKTVNAVEIWQPYLMPWHAHIYSQVWVGDVCELAPDLPHHGVVLMIDVLEHIPKAKAKQMLARLDFGHLVAVVPPDDIRPNTYGGNPHEEHVSTWAGREFPEAELAELRHGKLCLVWRKP